MMRECIYPKRFEECIYTFSSTSEKWKIGDVCVHAYPHEDNYCTQNHEKCNCVIATFKVKMINSIKNRKREDIRGELFC